MSSSPSKTSRGGNNSDTVASSKSAAAAAPFPLDLMVAAAAADDSSPANNYVTQPPKLKPTGLLTGKISTLFRRESVASQSTSASAADLTNTNVKGPPPMSGDADDEQSTSLPKQQRIFYSSHNDDDSDDSFESRMSRVSHVHTKSKSKTTRSKPASSKQRHGNARTTSFYSDDDGDESAASPTSAKTIVRHRGFSTSIQSLFLDEPLVCAACGCFGLILSNRTEYLLQLRQDRRGVGNKASYNNKNRLPSRLVAYGLVITILFMCLTFVVFGFGTGGGNGMAAWSDGYSNDNDDGSSSQNGDDAGAGYSNNDDAAAANGENDDAAAADKDNDDDKAAQDQDDDGVADAEDDNDAVDGNANDDANAAEDDAQEADDDNNNYDDYYAANDDDNRRLRDRLGQQQQPLQIPHPGHGIFKLRDTQECLWNPVIDFISDEWYRDGLRPETSYQTWHRRQQQQKYAYESESTTAEERDLGSNIRVALLFSFLLFLGIMGRRRRVRTRFYLVRSRAQEDHLFYASTQVGSTKRVNFDDTREDRYEGACSHTLCGCYPVDVISKDDKVEEVEVLDTGVSQRKPRRVHEDFVARGFSCLMAVCCGAVCKCWFQCLSICALAQEAREMRLLIPPRYQRIDYITHQPFHEYQKDVNNLRHGWMGKGAIMRGIMPHWNALSRLSRYILLGFTISIGVIVATLLFNPRAAFSWQDAVVLAATFLQSFLVLFIVHGIFHKSDLSNDAVIKLFAGGFLIAVPAAFFFEGLLVNLVLFGAWGLYELFSVSIGESFATWVFDHWRLIWIVGELFNAYVVAAVTEELCKYYTFRAVEHPDLMFLTGLQLEDHHETAVDGGVVNYPFSSHYVQEINKDMSDEISVASHRNRGFRGQKRTGSSVGKSLLNGPGMENFEDEEPDVRSYRQKAMAITTGMISVAVGLACAENFLYVFVLGGALGSANGEDDHKGDILQAWIVLFFRSIFPVHALAAAMQSINMIRKFVETTEDDGHRIGVGRIILPAVLLHGTFDAMLMGINVYIETSWDRYLEENDGNVGEDPPYNSIVVNTVAWMSITTIMIIGLVWYFVQNRRQSKRLAELEVVERIKLQNNAGTNGFSARQHVRLKTKNLEIV